jgi:tryptophan-rich sensory protein
MKILRLIVSILICQLAGLVGSVFTYDSISTWYSALIKPGFSPPNWVFAPVWITLYVLMGIALYIVWERGTKRLEVNKAITLFFVQLALNSLWSIIFFGLRMPFFAFIEIIILWVMIAIVIYKFYSISKTAAVILLPYIIWVSIAALLNLNIWLLN